jgi:hypothetical protein
MMGTKVHSFATLPDLSLEELVLKIPSTAGGRRMLDLRRGADEGSLRFFGPSNLLRTRILCQTASATRRGKSFDGIGVGLNEQLVE